MRESMGGGVVVVMDVIRGMNVIVDFGGNRTKYVWMVHSFQINTPSFHSKLSIFFWPCPLHSERKGVVWGIE